MHADTTTITLVLGTGVARGLAHIGAIRVLREYGLGIQCIAGSSMGALIGGINIPRGPPAGNALKSTFPQPQEPADE